MAWAKQYFNDGDYVPSDLLNNFESGAQDDIYRLEGLKSGSYEFFRNADNYIVSGNFFNPTLSGTTNGSLVFYRDINNFIISGNIYVENKNVSITTFRNVNNYIISGIRTVI